MRASPLRVWEEDLDESFQRLVDLYLKPDYMLSISNLRPRQLSRHRNRDNLIVK